MNQRTIELPGVFNFRDTGGYRTLDGRTTRWGRLFRSGELHRLEPEGITTLRTTLGLRTIIDLRWQDDLDRAGTLGLLAAARIDRHHLPFGDAEKLKDIPPLPVGLAYLPLADRSGGDVVRVARALTKNPALPAVIHCSAGKDRTGIVIALLLALLGVDDDTIIEDYALTGLIMPHWIAYLIERGELPPDPTDEPHPGDEIEPDAIQAMLEALRGSHGTIEGYFRRHGMDNGEITRLRDLLLA